MESKLLVFGASRPCAHAGWLALLHKSGRCRVQSITDKHMHSLDMGSVLKTYIHEKTNFHQIQHITSLYASEMWMHLRCGCMTRTHGPAMYILYQNSPHLSKHTKPHHHHTHNTPSTSTRICRLIVVVVYPLP